MRPNPTYPSPDREFPGNSIVCVRLISVFRVLFRVAAQMERFFVSRSRAISLLVETRQSLLAEADHSSSPTEAQRMRAAVDQIDRLLLDVRAGRTREFELSNPTPMHIVVSL